MQKLESLLKNHGLRRTEVRLQVLSAFSEQDKAYSQQDLQDVLGNIDRVTLYRTLRSFEDKGLIHRAIDGTDQAKYALCQSHCTSHAHQDDHIHFHCVTCGKTVCIDDVQVPTLQLPKGYTVQDAHLIVRGHCGQC